MAEKRTLRVGDSYQYLGFKIEVIRRERDIIFAEHPEYGIEVFRVISRKPSKFPDGTWSRGGEGPPSTGQWGIKPSGHFRMSERARAEAYFERLVRLQPRG